MKYSRAGSSVQPSAAPNDRQYIRGARQIPSSSAARGSVADSCLVLVMASNRSTRHCWKLLSATLK